MTDPVANTSTWSSSYTARPRWRRAWACMQVLPHALGLLVPIRRHLQRVEQNLAPQALPDVLARLTPNTPGTTWWGLGPPLSPGACAAVAHRVVTRGRRNRCLPRALLLFGLMQRTTLLPVHFCLGVQRAHPQRQLAHAWIEARGVPIAESTDPHATHRLLYRYPPAP